jgi:hypothetical protein
VRRGGWRLLVARWLVPDESLAELARDQAVTAPDGTAPTAQAAAPVPDAWADVCEQTAWRLLVLTEQMRPALDSLETGEEDPDRLARMYRVDHGVTQMRRVARDLRVLAGRGGEEIAGHTTSLLDVIRMAASAIEHYGRVSVGPVAELAVVAYAADDIASLLAALADNATRYSPAQVTVGAHLLADGSVMLRVEDAGMGIEPRWLLALNSALDGPAPGVGLFNGRHTGFTVVHRLARRHGLRVQLAGRQPPMPGAVGGASGMIAMLVIPAALLCEIPDELPPVQAHAGGRSAPAVPAQLRARYSPVHADPVQVAVPPQGRPDGGNVETLPRREPGSIRTPVRGSRATPGKATPGKATQNPLEEGFAFAADLRAFSTALGTGQQTGAEVGEDRPGDAEGRLR